LGRREEIFGRGEGVVLYGSISGYLRLVDRERRRGRILQKSSMGVF